MEFTMEKPMTVIPDFESLFCKIYPYNCGHVVVDMYQ